MPGRLVQRDMSQKWDCRSLPWKLCSNGQVSNLISSSSLILKRPEMVEKKMADQNRIKLAARQRITAFRFRVTFS